MSNVKCSFFFFDISWELYENSLQKGMGFSDLRGKGSLLRRDHRIRYRGSRILDSLWGGLSGYPGFRKRAGGQSKGEKP
jgi:hypothetical protein